MHTLTRFGQGSRVYTFPADGQVSYSDNFGQLVTKTQRLAGVHGGISSLGVGRGLQAIGTVRADVWLEFTDAADASDKVDSVREMAEWGLQPLFMQPLVGVERWCWARVTDIQTPMNVHNVPHRRMKVPITFEVTDPFWLTTGTETLWGEFNWGGADWGNGATAETVTASEDLAITVGGNTFTLARISILNDSGADASEIVIQRVVNEVVEDEVGWSGTLADGETLEIDPRRQWVVVNGALDMSLFEARQPDWIRLKPGANTLRVTLAGEVDVTVSYLERYI